MQPKEVTRCLKSFGWSIHTGQPGDAVGHLALLGRIVQIVYGLNTIRDQQKLGVMLSLTTSAFSQACWKIRGERRRSPLIRAWNPRDIQGRQRSSDTTIAALGTDFAKNVFQLNGVNRNGTTMLKRRVMERISEMLPQLQTKRLAPALRDEADMILAVPSRVT